MCSIVSSGELFRERSLDDRESVGMPTFFEWRVIARRQTYADLQC